MMFEILWCHSLTLATCSFNRYKNMNDRSLAWSHRKGRTLTDGWGGKYRNSSFLVKPQNFCLTIKFFVVWPNNKKMYRAEGPGIYKYIYIEIYAHSLSHIDLRALYHVDCECMYNICLISLCLLAHLAMLQYRQDFQHPRWRMLSSSGIL